MSYFIIIKKELDASQKSEISKSCKSEDFWETESFICGYKDVSLYELIDEILDIVGDEKSVVCTDTLIDIDSGDDKLKYLFSDIKGDENVYEESEDRWGDLEDVDEDEL